MEDRVEELEDEMDELKSSYEEQIAALQPKVDDSNQTLLESNSTVSQAAVYDINSSKVESVDINVTAIQVDVNKSDNVKNSEVNSSK
ncbi:MAG: hypothetical protein WBF77_13820 [Sulfurimonadaceae bacterium]